jgi:hypothetical protein
VVNPAYQNDHGFRGMALSFDQNDAVKITFDGQRPWTDDDFTGMSSGEVLTTQKDPLAPRAYPAAPQGDGDGTDLNAESIPEPASVLLGLVGTAVFAFRRRR